MKVNPINISGNYGKYQHYSASSRSFDMPCDSVSFDSNNKQKNKDLSLTGKMKKIFKSFRTEKTHYSSVNEGFKEYFEVLQPSLINEITLTDEQKEILNKRISEFETYKASLSDSELDKLEKNKHSMIDFSIKDGVPDSELKGYTAFLSRYESFKNGDYTDITNEELSQLLYYTDTTDLVSDGKIGSFAQGRTGDCWLLSMLGNYASTQEGEANIANRISEPDENGTYTVTFDDFFDPSKKTAYTVSQKELQDYDLLDENSMFSSGDLDVRILEIAVGKMLNEYLLPLDKFSSDEENTNNIFDSFEQESEQYSPSCITAEGALEKKMLVHRALGYQSDIVIYEKKPENLDEENILTDFADKEYIEDTGAEIFAVKLELSKENGKLKFTPVVTPTDYGSLSDVINQNEYKASDLCVSSYDKSYSSNERENRYISTGHVFNVTGLNEDGSVTVNDPYNSAFLHTIDNSDFERVFHEITYIPC